MSTIRVELTATINLGDYNNIKIDVGFEDSVGKGELYDQAFDRIYEFVEGKLQEKVDEAQGTTKKSTPKKKTIKRKGH